MINKLSIFSWNICLGVLHKTHLIKLNLDINNIDILFINEAEISSDINLDILKIPGYDLVSSQKQNHCGHSRIVAYIKSNLKYETLDVSVKLEAISIKIFNNTITGFYRPFKLENFSNHTDYLNEFISHIDQIDDINQIIIGDFNLDANQISKKSYRFSNLYEKWSNFYESKNLKIINDFSPTWSRTVKNKVQTSCLDHIYVTNNLHNVNFLKLDSTSDHDIIGLELITQEKIISNETMFVRSWKDYNKELAIERIINKNWTGIEHLTSQQLADRIDLNLSAAVEEVTPQKPIKFIKRNFQWSHEINRMIVNKKNIVTKLRKTKNPSLCHKIKELKQKNSICDIRRNEAEN